MNETKLTLTFDPDRDNESLDVAQDILVRHCSRGFVIEQYDGTGIETMHCIYVPLSMQARLIEALLSDDKEILVQLEHKT